MLLPNDVAQSVKEALAGMTDAVTVKVYWKADDPSSETVKQLWDEIQALTPHLRVELSETLPGGMTPEKMEGVVSEIWHHDTFTGLRYLGVPSGYEFGPLIETLVEIAQGVAPEVSPSVAEWLRGLERPLHLEVFVTPTWPYCPRAVRLAQSFARMNPRYVTADLVDAASYPDASDRYGISGVPDTFANGTDHVVGAVPESQLWQVARRVMEG